MLVEKNGAQWREQPFEFIGPRGENIEKKAPIGMQVLLTKLLSTA
jgi:hypothetical protein